MYIERDLNINQFNTLVFLFVISISLIILSPRILEILLGRDQLGLISYYLVIYSQKINSLRSGVLIISYNRGADIGLVTLICIIFV